MLTVGTVDAAARKALIEQAAKQHNAITRRQAGQLHFDYRRVATAVRAGWLAEPVPGVLVLTDGPQTWHQRLMVVILAAGRHGVASHRSAARLQGLDGFETSRNATIEASVQRAFPLDPAVAARAVDLTTMRPDLCTTLRTLWPLGSVAPRKTSACALTSAVRRG